MTLTEVREKGREYTADQKNGQRSLKCVIVPFRHEFGSAFFARRAAIGMLVDAIADGKTDKDRAKQPDTGLR